MSGQSERGMAKGGGGVGERNGFEEVVQVVGVRVGVCGVVRGHACRVKSDWKATLA